MGRLLTSNPRLNAGIKNITLRDFHSNMRKVLIIRETGGLGDILMHRMIFEDFKRIMPDAEIIFALPPYYHDAVRDHPFIDKIIDSRNVPIQDYTISYNTSSACARYEMYMAPYSGKHRSDIWANHCGVNLSNHNMHFNLPTNVVEFGKNKLNKIKEKNKPLVAFCPISAMVTKNLLDWQMETVINTVRSNGGTIFCMHSSPIKKLLDMGVPVLTGLNIKEWIGTMNTADYIISVDTAGVHFGGGVGKPTLGIFTFADGLVYNKYSPKFILVQKHRNNGDWSCGPCYNWAVCPKTKKVPKPCLTEITSAMLEDGINNLFNKYPYISLD